MTGDGWESASGLCGHPLPKGEKCKRLARHKGECRKTMKAPPGHWSKAKIAARKVEKRRKGSNAR